MKYTLNYLYFRAFNDMIQVYDMFIATCPEKMRQQVYETYGTSEVEAMVNVLSETELQPFTQEEQKIILANRDVPENLKYRFLAYRTTLLGQFNDIYDYGIFVFLLFLFNGIKLEEDKELEELMEEKWMKHIYAEYLKMV